MLPGFVATSRSASVRGRASTLVSTSLRKKARILVAVGCSGLGALLIGSTLGGVHSSSAHPTLYVSTGGSDANPCTAAAPCLTFNRAYRRAAPGAVVDVRSGTYPEQAIGGTKAKPGVVFRPARGARVTVDWFEVHADKLELRGFHTGGWNAHEDSDGFTARNLDAANFGIYGAANLRILGGDYGPSYKPSGTTLVNYIAYGGTDTNPVGPRNVLIDGAYIHDVRRGSASSHTECMFVNAGDGITIRNSRFQRCDVFDIFFTRGPYGPPATHVLLENNFFDEATVDGRYDVCCTYYAVRFSDQIGQLDHVTLRYNSALQSLNVGTTNNVDVQLIANVGPRRQSECGGGIAFAYNVWTAARCSRTDRRAPSRFVDPEHLNLHLKRGSRAVNAGDPTNFPKRDIDGQRRPTGRRPDAGADERR